MNARLWGLNVLLAGTAFACGGGSPELGKWVESSPGPSIEHHLEILSDGRLIETVKYPNRSPDAHTWTYQKLDGGVFQLRDTSGTWRKISVSVFGDNMTVRDDVAKTEILYKKE